ncbi:MAG: response regulator [Pseudomonadota bacterium]
MYKILIIDDDETLSGAVTAYFSEMDFQAVQAFDALEGIEQYKKEKPDLVLMDHFMPKMTGLEGLKLLKREDTNALVIMMTGAGSERIAVEAMKAGAEDYVTKPLVMDTLVSLVKMHIKRHRERLEHIRRKEELERYNRYLAHNMEHVNEAIIATDAQGQIEYVNKAAEQFWLYKREDVIGLSMWDIFEKEKINLAPQKVKKALFSTGKFKEEFKFVRKDENILYGLLSASFIKDDPIKAIVAVVTDLTRIKDMENRLIKSERMASLGHLADGVAHQVRNVLITLGGYANLLKKKMDSDDKNRTYLEPIIESVDRLDDMVREIETYAYYTHKDLAEFDQIELLPVINSAVKKTFKTKKFKDITVSLDIEPEDITLVGDKALLRELFFQIMLNGCEAMGSEGSLKIKGRARQDSTIIKISDTGKGIPKDDLPLVYDPFYTTRNRGAGVGLTIVLRILETHNGSIDIESTPGKGTTFTIVLPKTSPPQA